jgi:GNAT superfamily N-acetyltransferase
MPYSFRLATPADLDPLLLMMRQMQADDPWSEGFDEANVRNDLRELLRNSIYGLVYLACQEQAPVGYLIICFDYSLEYRGKGAWIDELFVQSSCRGQGMGTQFLDLAESASRQHGAQFLHLEVSHGNKALELYRRRGFLDHQRFLMSKSLKARETK